MKIDWKNEKTRRAAAILAALLLAVLLLSLLLNRRCGEEGNSHLCWEWQLCKRDGLQKYCNSIFHPPSWRF